MTSTPTQTKWIESPEGITTILKHGVKTAQSYQRYLDSPLDFLSAHNINIQDNFTEWCIWCEARIAEISNTNNDININKEVD